jgi:hypothetical protein
MTGDELNQIEQKLSIQLPETYRHRMRHYPLVALSGNTTTELLDQVDAIVILNLELRKSDIERQWARN